MNKKLVSILMAGAMLITPGISLAVAIPDNPVSGFVDVVNEDEEMNVNEGSVTFNAGYIANNKGEVATNFEGGIIYKNDGVVGTNNDIVDINNGSVNNNDADVFHNYGTVTNNANGIVTKNYEGGTVNGGRVVMNFGGTVNSAAVDTQYYRLILPENVRVECEDMVNDFGQGVWIPGGKEVEFTVIPEDGYIIISEVTASGGAVSTGFNTFTVTDASTDITVTATAVKQMDYAIIEGNGQIYAGKGNLVFTVSGPKEKLKSIIITHDHEDGWATALKPENYIAENVDGFGYFTIKETALLPIFYTDLKEHDYHIEFLYVDGSSQGGFSLPEHFFLEKAEASHTHDNVNNDTAGSNNKATSPDTMDMGAIALIKTVCNM